MKTPFHSLPLRSLRLLRSSAHLPTLLLPCLLLAAIVLTVPGCSREARQARTLKRGDALFAEGRYREATLEYLNVLRLDRSNETAIVNSAVAHYELGDVPQAIPFFVVAVRLQPENLELRTKLATLWRAVGASRNARNEALEILAREPGHADALCLFADTAAGPEEVEDAMGRLDAYAEALSGEAKYHLARANLHLKQDRIDEAEADGLAAVECAPDDPGVHQAMASFYSLRGDRDKAEDAFRRACELAPPVSPVRVLYAAFKYATGRPDEARAMLDEVLEANPDFLPALEKAGEFALAEGRLDDCAGMVDRMLQQIPDHFGGQMLEARLTYARGESADAVTAFEALRDRAPGSGRLRAQLATAYLADGKIDPARTEFREALRLDPSLAQAALQLAEVEIRSGNPGTAIRGLKAALSQHPDMPQAMLLLSRAYLAEGDPDRAVAVLERMAEIQPENPGVYFLEGQIFQQQEKTEEARAAYEQALALEPRLAQALARLVAMDLGEDRPEAALARVSAALAGQPDSAGLYRLLGRVHELAGNVAEAETAYRKAIDLEPDSSTAYVALGRMLSRDPARLDEALQQAEEAVRVREDNVAALMMAGMLLERTGNYEEALDRYERLLAVRPDVAGALNNAAYIYAEQLGRLDEAFALAQRARELAPGDPATADTLGWIAYRRGDHPWALILLREGAEHYPDHPEVQYHLGMASAANGDEAAALVALEKARTADAEAIAGLADALVALLRVPVSSMTEAQRPLADAVLAHDPENPSARVRLALLEEEERPEDAAAVYAGILGVYPQFRPATLRLMALHAGPLNDPDRALALARDARTRHPDDAGVAGLAGRLAFRFGDYAWADSLLREAATAGPEDPSLAYLLGLTAYIQGDPEEAERRVSALPESGFPEAQEAVECAAMLRALRGERADEDLMRRARAVEEGGRLVFPAKMLRARAAAAAGEAAEAAGIYESLLERSPSFVPAAREAAGLYAGALGDNDRARELAMQARQARPTDPEIAALLGRVMVQAGDAEWAAKLLEESLRRAPDNAMTWYYLGLCRKARNDRRGAREALEKAGSLGLDPALLAEARRTLAEGEVISP